MVKTLSRHGNSLALIIDKPILELLNITEKTKLKLSTDGASIFIKPLGAEQPQEKKNHTVSQDPKLQKSYEKLVERYAEDLKKLAKT